MNTRALPNKLVKSIYSYLRHRFGAYLGQRLAIAHSRLSAEYKIFYYSCSAPFLIMSIHERSCMRFKCDSDMIYLLFGGRYHSYTDLRTYIDETVIPEFIATFISYMKDFCVPERNAFNKNFGKCLEIQFRKYIELQE